MTQKQENHDTQNVVPLSGDEIKSILKSQSDAVFEDKNISNNSKFEKRSLIDIALDFETKQNLKENKVIDDSPEHNKNLQEKNEVTSDEPKTEDVMLHENKKSDNKKDNQSETDHSNNEVDINSTSDINLDKIEEDIQSEKIVKDENLTDVEINNHEQQNETTVDAKDSTFIKADEQTQQALDSVRDAISQSMIKSEDETTKSSEDNNKLSDNVSETILKDYHNFENILSTLSSLSEKALYEVFENKILEISYDLAGYQIDKMPEKYEKKIKSFLKSINCYEDKITIEVNDRDFEALSKIKDFNKNKDKKVFVSNKELSRGDIVLNCDGMRYSEKSVYIT